MPKKNPTQILHAAYQEASKQLNKSFINNKEIAGRVEFVSRCASNRAGVRLLLACVLAKVHKPRVDICKPYTGIRGNNTYSGRMYDETYITNFINKYNLPCNPTTAFLTPALRNRNEVLTPNTDLVGRPKELYNAVLQLLDDVEKGKVSEKDVLKETIRYLVLFKDERERRIKSLMRELEQSRELPLSSEDIVNLIQQHLNCHGASRLPVLIVAAAYETASTYLQERVLSLTAHTAADKQTGALGDVQVTLIDDNKVVTSYEMKMKRVTVADINRALQKIQTNDIKVDNYIFITTDVIERDVAHYAASLYKRTGGTEFVVLDCVGFLRHFLHLFHRLRLQYLNVYQKMILEEPESGVSHPLKEAFLALRRAAESAILDNFD